MKTAALEVRDFAVSRNARSVVTNACMRVQRGETCLIIGDNASGKSTLLAAMATVLRREVTGKLWINGNFVEPEWSIDRCAALRRCVGYQPQAFPAMDTTVLENVVVVAQIRGDARAQALHAAYQALNIVGLKARRHDQAKDLNGGARARLALAMAVAGLPQGAPVLLDEPSAGLSAKSIQEVGCVINDLQESGEFAFVIVTHDRLLAGMLRKPRYFLLKERNLYPFAIRSRAHAAKHAPAIARADAEIDPAELPSVENPPQPAVPRGESHESLVGQIFGSDEQVRDVLTIHA